MCAASQQNNQRRLSMINGSGENRKKSWRWMILFSRFLWSFIALGRFKAMGVFLPHIVVSFSTSTAVAGFVTSASVGVGPAICGPFAGALLKVWSSQKVTMAGGVFVGIAIIAGSYATSAAQLGALFAASSIGEAFVQVALTQTIMEYFPDDFAFANGITLAGGTIGMMVIPPLVDYLVFLYGWRNALALMGAVTFNYLLCGALLRPYDRGYSLAPNHIDGLSELPTSSNPTTNSSSDPKANPGRIASVLRRVSEILQETFDTQALTQPTFLIFQVVSVLEGMVYSMWHLFLIPQGIELGFGNSHSAFLATFGGIGSLIGRLGHGILVDHGLIKASTLFILACLAFAVPNLLDPLAVSSYTAMATLASITGAAIGVIYPLTFVLMRDMVGDRQMSAYGWLFVSHGTGLILGGVFGGWVHDISKAYEIVFMVTGAISVLMATIIGLMQCSSFCVKPED